MRKVTT